MSKFQVVALKPMSGIAKVSGKPYVMLIVSGVFTDGDGVCTVGETVFMQGADRPLPTLVIGTTYEPVFGVRANAGKFVPEISALRPLAKAA